MLNSTELKQQVSIVALLEHLGFQPKKRSGGNLLYISMLRDSDTNPSFSVNEAKGVWFDHGMGKGGNIIDFGLEFWRPATVKEVILKLNGFYGVEVGETPLSAARAVHRPRLATKLPHYQIEELKELGNNWAITKYLKSRGVWNIPNSGIKEVYYYIEDEKKVRKQFYSAGWQNENGGWEVRNPNFKGCLGRKGITFVPGNNQNLAVFEGYLNYLSWKLENKNLRDNVLVLNSLSFLKAGIARSQSFDHINIFFDLDASGVQATQTFRQAVPRAIDCSRAYAGYNDYNEKIEAELRLLSDVKPGYMANVKVPFQR